MRWIILSAVSAVTGFSAVMADAQPTIPIALASAVVTGLGVIMSGRIVVPTFAYNRETARADAAETREREAIRLIITEFVPAQEAARVAIADSAKVLAATNEILRDIPRPVRPRPRRAE